MNVRPAIVNVPLRSLPVVFAATVKLTVPLETAPDTNRDEVVLTGRSPFQGAKVANISPALADELHLDSQTEGVVVIDLADDATAASVGFRSAMSSRKMSSVRARAAEPPRSTRQRMPRTRRAVIVRVAVTVGKYVL